MHGCASRVTGFSAYCGSHRRRNRRHGHPDQRGITVQQLESFKKRVKARIETNKSNPAWQLLQDRWRAVAEIAKVNLTRYQNGAPHNRYEREAWTNIAKLAASAEPLSIIEIVLAMYLMQEEYPHRFRSDQAFGGQLVRRVRSLAPISMASYYDHKSGKPKRVYRDLTPRTMAILAKLLQETFGVAGLTVARLEREEMEKLCAERQALHNALESLI